jgi:hypothetical protein
MKIQKYAPCYNLRHSSVVVYNIDHRPHGTTAFTLAFHGILAPSALFISNKRMFNFAKNYFKSKIPSVDIGKVWKRRALIHPIV